MIILGHFKQLATASLLLVSSFTFAQGGNMMDQPQTNSEVGGVTGKWLPSLVTDGAFDRTPHVNRLVQWSIPREADVMYSKRVWREIDVRQKQNMPFRYQGDDYTGGGMFIEIVLDALKKGRIKGYSTVDDRFSLALSKEQIMEMLQGKTDTIAVEDAETGNITYKVVNTEFNPDAVTRYRLKEDWIFDRNLGRMVVRIIGVAPLKDIYNEDGSYRATTPMFWIYYPELRKELVQYEVFNPENDIARMTWDEFFENRYFASYVVKTSNPFDLFLKDMGLQGTDALYEGQRISEELFNKEHDMWVY